jgi:hypothetical protein
VLTIDFLLLRVRICSNGCSISIWTTKNNRKWLRCACLVWFFMPLSAVWVKAVKVAHVGPERLWMWQLWWQAWILGEQVVMGWMSEHRSRSSANMKYFLYCGVWRSVITATDKLRNYSFWYRIHWPRDCHCTWTLTAHIAYDMTPLLLTMIQFVRSYLIGFFRLYLNPLSNLLCAAFVYCKIQSQLKAV